VNKEKDLTLQMRLTVQKNYQNEVKICKNSPYCVSHAVEIWGNQSYHDCKLLHLYLNLESFYFPLNLSTVFSNVILEILLALLEACRFLNPNK
jgi:hypothetical protein